MKLDVWLKWLTTQDFTSINVKEKEIMGGMENIVNNTLNGSRPLKRQVKGLNKNGKSKSRTDAG